MRKSSLLTLIGISLAVSSAGLQRAGSPPVLPDPKLTPGDVLPVTRADVCVPGYSKKVRDVPKSVKDQAYAEYGIASHRPGDFEVDHLISLELGGSNSIRNLWPQSYRTQPWNAHVKDRLENRLHSLVCSGKLDLRTAQQEIASDWIAAFKKFVPAARGAKRRTRTMRSPGGQVRANVWVNLSTGTFWQPGTRYYGRTKRGAFMTEQEALAQGYHPAGGR